MGGPGFLWGFSLDDGLVLIRKKFRDYAYSFAHGFILSFFPVHHYIYEDI